MATIGTTLKKKVVVVVGGGVAGALLVKFLQLHVHVVLIDPKEYFEIPWANLRSTVEPSFGERMVINHKDYFKNRRIVTSSAVNINENEVVTSDGRRISYNYLVIATGRLASLPKTRIERIEQFYADNKRIESSNSILIIGGGPTGVELAGEIVADLPKKQSESDAGNAYKTSNGETMIANFHFTCTGRPMASSWLKSTMLNEFLNSDGRLMVNENLRVKGQSNIFAIGDITDIRETETRDLCSKACSSCGQEPEVVDQRRQTKKDGSLQDQHGDGDGFSRKKEGSCAVTHYDVLRVPTGHDKF